MFYGFIPVRKPKIRREDLSLSDDCRECLLARRDTDKELEKYHRLEHKIGVLRSYLDGHFQKLPTPTMVCFKGQTNPQKNSTTILNLLVLGQQESVAEAIVMKATTAILSEQREEPLRIEINHVGDRECFSRFERDFLNYTKKNAGNLPPELKTHLEVGIEEIFRQYKDLEGLEEFWASAPKPLNYLDQNNINHFREILEYLEHLEMPYSLNHFLIPSWNNCHKTIFQIKNESGEILALGLRYCGITKKLGLRKEVPIIYVSVKNRSPKQKTKNTKKLKPKIFLMHLGNKAKAKSLLVIEALRKAEIPTYHALTKDRLSNQISVAEKFRFSYVLIIGEKEVLENSIIVRNNDSRIQEIVPISELVKYLKRVVGV